MSRKEVFAKRAPECDLCSYVLFSIIFYSTSNAQLISEIIQVLHGRRLRKQGVQLLSQPHARTKDAVDPFLFVSLPGCAAVGTL